MPEIISAEEIRTIANSRALNARTFARHLALVNGEAAVTVARRMGIEKGATAMLREVSESMARLSFEADHAKTREEVAAVAKTALRRLKWLGSLKKARAVFGESTLREWKGVKDLAKEAVAGTRLRSDDVNLLLARSKEMATAPVMYWSAAFLGKKADSFIAELNRTSPTILKVTRATWSSKAN